VSYTKLIITEPRSLPTIISASENLGIDGSRILIFDPVGQTIPDGFQSWRSLLEHGECDWVRFDDEQTSKSTTAALLFSSGTTGLPKAAAISHKNLVSQHTLVYEVTPSQYEVRMAKFGV
jgi:4-coumarate--CoA ligase